MTINILFIAASVASSSPLSFDAAQTPVSYADLDVSTEAGQRTLNRRVRSAVRKVCGNHMTAPISERLTIKQCYRSAMQGAERDVETIVARARMDRQLASASLAVASPR